MIYIAPISRIESEALCYNGTVIFNSECTAETVCRPVPSEQAS